MVASIPLPLTSPNLELRVASGDVLDVREFTVREGMSVPFSVEIKAVSSTPDVDFESIIGRPARFDVRTNDLLAGGGRSWDGVCAHIEQVGVEEDWLSTYVIHVVPRLWLLGQRRNYRVFQQVSEPQIVLSILAEWQIEPVLRLELSDFKARRYRVQYGETDLAFVQRMLEDAGIAYYFEVVDGETKLVLADRPNRNDARPLPLPFVPTPNDAITNAYATAVHLARQVRPGKYTQRDVDYRRPADFPLLATAAADDGEDVELQLERFHQNYGAFVFQSDDGEPTPMADDRGRQRTDLAEGQRQVQKRLDAQRGSARICSFRTTAHDLRPGVVLRLSNHPRAELAETRRLLVVETQFRGTAVGEWVHDCTTRFADIDHRPELVTPKPRTQGVESATVVGPPGEEIHTDEFGRVRVQFHWDREGKRDDKASCWVPVSQPWGGASFGALSIPRIGQEVLVDFLGADPDRPVVVGRVFTRNQPVPYSLPGKKTVTGLRSESSPKLAAGVMRAAEIAGKFVGGGVGQVTPSPSSSPLGGGVPMNLEQISDTVSKSRHFQAASPAGETHKWSGSEVTMQDDQGAELLYVQAQKDMNTVVKNSETGVVGNVRSVNVGADDVLSVGNKQAIYVAADRAVGVGATQSHMVMGDVTQQSVEGNQTFLTKLTHTAMAKEHRITGEELIVLTVGASTIVMRPDFIIVQATDVFINPGADAAKAAIESGTRPETAEEKAAREAREAHAAARARALTAGTEAYNRSMQYAGSPVMPYEVHNAERAAREAMAREGIPRWDEQNGLMDDIRRSRGNHLDNR